MDKLASSQKNTLNTPQELYKWNSKIC